MTAAAAASALRFMRDLPRGAARPAAPSPAWPRMQHAVDGSLGANGGNFVFSLPAWLASMGNAALLRPRPRVLLDGRGAVGVEGLDGLQAPGLAPLALGLGPHDGLPVGRQHQARAGVGDLDAVTAGLVDVEEERLLDGVLVRAGLDVHARLQEDVSRAQHLLAAVHLIADGV